MGELFESARVHEELRKDNRSVLEFRGFYPIK